ncbi:asparagine synthase [Colletotrichum tamarilloi]|uniref:Asparagine synthase n=1 Tax=Colletotrichum tamarilloi TaxID=1209934 RepID=A0ABQ9RLX7_9PEZI|nr:asparagine synthase [Colletotrichum tamarilloi]KAK1507473.1 asparagine synthase [Colletotrichum tamarilloi]
MCGISACVTLPPGYHFHTEALNGYASGLGNLINNDGNDETRDSQDLKDQLRRSLDAISHRGPDAQGVWASEDGFVGMGHCRLAINDLTPDGNQPIHSDDNAIHAVVNGEIYDHDRIREECREKGYVFKGRSDSEVILALYKAFGAPRFLDHLRGEFAFVLYDETAGKVILARDRFGIKPLLWTFVRQTDGVTIPMVAPEAKAFLPLGGKPQWDVGAIVDGGWMQDGRSLFKGVKKVLPGHWMEITKDGMMQIHQYWDADYKDKTEGETRSVDEMIQGLRDKLTESIRLRLRADVPIGIYLSGGIDSSLVAGIVTHLVRDEGIKIGNKDATSRISCFTIQFPRESGFDESDIAERTAEHLGIQISKKQIDENELANNFADCAYHCEHHHFDLNCVGKFALSTLPNANGVKVVLTGEGADEHFAGYAFFPPDLLREPDLSMPDSPLVADSQLREHMQRSTERDIKMLIPRAGAFEHGWEATPGIQMVNNTILPPCIVAWHPNLDLFAPWVREDKRWANLDCKEVIVKSFKPSILQKMQRKWHPLHTAQYIYSKGPLPNILLSCLGDLTEMSHSVEARTPFLDHKLTEYVNNLPPSLKMAYTPDKIPPERHQGPWWEGIGVASQALTEKWILREAAKPFILKELYERQKHPFTAPIKWSRSGPLHDMLQNTLTRERVENLGFVDYKIVEDALDRGSGEKADVKAFRILLFVAAWVTLGERLGIPKASLHD